MKLLVLQHVPHEHPGYIVEYAQEKKIELDIVELWKPYSIPQIENYDGMMPEMDKNSLVIDDPSHYETEKIIEMMKPDIFCAGIKEKYAVQKMGIPLKQLHSYDYGGPYAGFEGAINFFLEMERMLTTDIWNMIDAPWKYEPSMMGSMVME